MNGLGGKTIWHRDLGEMPVLDYRDGREAGADTTAPGWMMSTSVTSAGRFRYRCAAVYRGRCLSPAVGRGPLAVDRGPSAPGRCVLDARPPAAGRLPQPADGGEGERRRGRLINGPIKARQAR